MQYGHLPGIDKPISRLVQGTVMIASSELEKSFALLDAVFELGCNTFDTANIYGGGDNERTVGRWIRERGIRDKVVIIAKLAHPKGAGERVTPLDITADLLESLSRFRTNTIDLCLLHRDDPTVPVSGIVGILNEHLKTGRIRAFGGSNWSYERIAEANDYARKKGLTPFLASSPNLSLAVQKKAPWDGCISISGPEGAAARAWYQNQEVALFPWSSLGGGFFSGRFTRDNLHTFTEGLPKLCVECYCTEENFKRLDRVRELADEKGLSIPQLALAWVLNQPMEIFPLVGCLTGDEFKVNVEALDVKLTPEEIAWLDLQSDTRAKESE